MRFLPFLLALAFAASGCDSSGSDAPAGFTGNPALLGMWAWPASDIYQDFLFFEYNASTRRTSFDVLEYDSQRSCSWSVGPITVSAITPTTMSISEDGVTISLTYSISGSTLRLTDSDRDAQTLQRSTRTRASMNPACPNNATRTPSGRRHFAGLAE